MDIIQAMRYIGNDVMERNVCGANFNTKNLTSRVETAGDKTRIYYDTPVGTIYEGRGMTEYTENVTKHFIVTLEDMKVLQYIAENTTFSSNAKAFKERDDYIGESGIATVSAASKWDDVKPKTKAKIIHKAMKIAKKAKKNLGKVRRGLRQKFIFKMMGGMQKSGLGTPKNAAYWKERGWI